MIRAKAIDENTVHVEISSYDFRVVMKEKEALKGAIFALTVIGTAKSG